MWKLLLNEIFRARGSSLPTPVLKWELLPLVLLGFLLGDLGIQEIELSLVETRAAAKTNRSTNPFRRGESTEEITQLQAEEKTPERSVVHAPSTYHVYWRRKALKAVGLPHSFWHHLVLQTENTSAQVHWWG